MATYTATMYVDGDTDYNSTAGGYQIGGDDTGTAYASCVLPSTYTMYESCSITCTLYSATAPSSWLSSWGCYLGIYKNGRAYGGEPQWITKSAFSSGSGSNSRTITVNLTGGYFEPDDEVEISFIGSNGGFVDSSDRCVYLRSATFTSTNATNTVTLKFNANGGSGAPSSMELEVNSSGIASFTIPSTKPTRTNYTFLGWSTSSSASTATYDPGEVIQLTEDDTLYAVWRLNATYTLSFNANGGSGEPGSMSAVSNANGESSFIIPDTVPTRPGYVFIGWDEDSSATDAMYTAGETFTTSGNATLYAIWNLGVSVSVFKSDVLWTDCAYTIALYLNGIKQYTLTNDGTGVYIAQNIDPDTYDLYISGTDTGIDITLPFEDDADPIEVKYHTITYHANDSDGGTVPNDVNAYFDGAYAPISDNVGGLVKTDHVFMGWNTSEDGTGTHYNPGDVISITSTLVLYAIWREATKAYIFDGTQWFPGDPLMYNETWGAVKMCMYTTEWNS